MAMTNWMLQGITDPNQTGLYNEEEENNPIAVKKRRMKYLQNYVQTKLVFYTS